MGAPTGFRSRLAQILASGAFAVTAEVTPNASGSPDQILGQVRAMKGYADAFNVTDCTRALVRISGLAGRALLLHEGVGPVPQRGRGGGDPKGGNEPDAAPVFEYTTEQFLAVAKKLRETGALAGGDVVDEPPNLFLGAAAHPFGGAPPGGG